ncbi:EAL domain-containing protein [Mesorhizobium sp. KR1-2]|uniref:EAL domain-containing protein n=1 Tax=Mesorhizobium sp. KR1-2 TaxID=3156609 RepID=UPI0032B3E36D
MSRTVGPAQIIRQSAGTSRASWGAFVLETAFQPIFAFQPGGKPKIVAYEGLVRPSLGGERISPGIFFSAIAVSERLDVETLTRTLHLHNAAACLAPDATIFVNFDPSLFTERSVAAGALDDMRKVMREVGIDPCRVVCEVTEQKAASPEALQAFVKALRAGGLRIAIDDYGAEDSDIKRVKALRPDIVKFDAQWIGRLMATGAGFALLTAMVEKFAEQGITTVFEGIEEGWQLELAEKSGASMVQGFVLARPEIVQSSFQPKPAEETTKELAAPEPDAKAAKKPQKRFGRRETN